MKKKVVNPGQEITLKELKTIGHLLLEKYLDLGYKFENQTVRKEAYSQLAKRLRFKQSSHFSMMHTIEEVLQANHGLRMMISQRKLALDRIKHSVFAPNIQELQKMANELNKDIA